MPARTKDYPIYTYDEPAVYKDFTGGINSDPSNEHLLDSELRDCVNMTYLSGALVKRKGAKKLCDISCTDNLINIQGVFLFTYRITYIIVAADGKLYQGIYNDNTTINLSRLQIIRTKVNQAFTLDEEDSFIGIEEKQPSETEILYNTNHEGYIQTYFKNLTTNQEFLKNERGSYFDISGGSINVGDVFTETNYLIEKRFLCIESFVKEYETPSQLHKWSLLNGDGKTFKYVKDGEEITLLAEEADDEILNELSSKNLLSVFQLNDLKQWRKNEIVFYNKLFYVCNESHINRYNSINDKELFIEISDITSTNYVENSYLVFQNHRKVEAATLNNKLYIATGTRIIEVYLENNELKAKPIKPYLCNYSEITNIGYNYMSPYPELAVASQKDTVTTSITGIKIRKTLGGRYVLTPVMNLQKGDDIKNYYFKWEKYINNTWYVVVPFSSQKSYLPGADGTIQIERKDYSSIEVDDADKYLYRCTFAKSFKLETTVVKPWDVTGSYKKGDYVSVGAHVYQCLRSHTKDSISYVNNEFSLEAYTKHIDADGNTILSQTKVTLWDEIYDLEMVPYLEYEIANFKEWDNKSSYKKGDYIRIKDTNQEGSYNVYVCIKTHNGIDYEYKNSEFETAPKNLLMSFNEQLWNFVEKNDGKSGYLIPKYFTIYDYIINKVDGEYFGSAVSVLFDNNIGINDTFLLIHSCTKVIADGSKLLFYADRYHSGQWFKTVINNPSYITDRGSLSFKTNKNEALIKIIPFQGNLIVFANSDNVGGSIHLVEGNGDDYDDQSGYYSPYRRKTINSSISCSNADSIQVCDNIIVFKYFNRVYYINASELSNETVKVTPCNDRVLNNEGEVKIPWESDECISEVTDKYYSLIWKEKYTIDEEGELILEHPGIRVKMYYKMLNELPDGSYSMPWLRDESDVFNSRHILYVRGKPLYVYHNTLVSFDDNNYKDIENTYECKIHFKAVDLNYESFLKLISNCIVSFHRNQYNKIDLDVIIKNEAGHKLLDSKSKRYAANDLGALHVGQVFGNQMTRIGTTIQDSKMFNSINMFPCLLADTTIYAKTDGSFTLSNITYHYTSIDAPDTNPSDIYKNITRPEED